MKKLLNSILIFTIALGLSKAAWAVGPSTNLDDYLIFAFSDFNFKGKNSKGGELLGGNIGVNAITVNPSSPVMRVGEIFMDTGTQVVADSFRMNINGSILGDLYTNNLVGNPTFTLNGIQSTFTPPVFSSIPTLFAPFVAGSQDIQVANNSTLNLAPGDYKALDINDNAILRLGSGVYTFSSFNIGKKVNVFTLSDTIIQIAGSSNPNVLDFHMNDQSYVGSEDPNSESIALFRVAGDKMNFGHNGTFYGEVLAPNADVDLGGAMDHYGRFVVDQVSSDFNSNVYYRKTNVVPEPSTIALLSSGLGAMFFRRRKK